MKQLIFAFLLVLTGACGGESQTITITVGEVAEDLFQATCSRAVGCGFQGPDEVDECVDTLVNLVCSDSEVQCGATRTMDRDDYFACLDAYDAFSCASLDAGDIPSECFTIMEYI